MFGLFFPSLILGPISGHLFSCFGETYFVAGSLNCNPSWNLREKRSVKVLGTEGLRLKAPPCPPKLLWSSIPCFLKNCPCLLLWQGIPCFLFSIFLFNIFSGLRTFLSDSSHFRTFAWLSAFCQTWLLRLALSKYYHSSLASFVRFAQIANRLVRIYLHCACRAQPQFSRTILETIKLALSCAGTRANRFLRIKSI